MAEKLSDNVGKKIVEALKMQNHQIEHEPISIEEETVEDVVENEIQNEAEEPNHLQLLEILSLKLMKFRTFSRTKLQISMLIQ